MLAANQILHKGRYRIINSFGQDETGGMYEAYDTVSDTNVVLRESVGKLGKVATSTQIEAVNAAFAGAAKALTEITHESLVSVHDYFSEIDRQYLVLEAVTGYDLSKFLPPEEPRPLLHDVLSWADQVLSALHYLHRLSPPAIHRDVRPENIKLTSGLKVKLLTERLSTNQGSDSNPSFTHTIGSAAFSYRPLEQLWSELDPASQRVILNSYDEKSAGVLLRPLDARSDLYSLAATFYNVLSGAVPCDALERSIAILDGKPDPLQKLSDLDASIPPEISDVFMGAMAIRRENRFDSAVLMRQVLTTSSVRVAERKAEQAVTTENPQAEVESPDARLERERLKADERQHEIEAEQAALDAERQRIEQRRSELDAERERQIAERDRLEREAQEARMRAEDEQKRLEEERLEAEAERRREEERQEEMLAEQNRIEAEAKKEMQLAEQHSVNNPFASEASDDDMLLELEPMQAKSDSAGNISVQLDEVFIDDGTAEISTEEDAAVQPVATDATTLHAEDAIFSDHKAASTFNWRVPAVAGAGLLLLVILAVSWKYVFTESAETKQPAAAEQTFTQTAPEPQTPAPDNQLNAVQEPPVASDPPATDQPQTTERQNQIQIAREKVKKPAAPPAAKTPAPKKKLTVDDLINDN